MSGKQMRTSLKGVETLQPTDMCDLVLVNTSICDVNELGLKLFNLI